ncbi:MAG TPA: hypothetical protein VHA05_03275 [Candidatus Saccharimonadales bacterium]|nr:hypothetical protein [Candidatus Saccharimonadales bacterium]
MRIIEVALAGIGLMISLIIFTDTLPSLAPRRRRRWHADTPALPRERRQLLGSTVASLALVYALYQLLN